MATLDSPRPHEALAARVADAAVALPAAQRLALSLRERDGAGYEAIAAALDVEVADVPELLVSARMAVREAVRHTAPPPLLTEYCPDARRLLSLRQDGEYLSPGEIDWLRAHVEHCDACRLSRRALREASLACRAWSDAARAPAPSGPATVLPPPDADAEPTAWIDPPAAPAVEAEAEPEPPAGPASAPEREPEASPAEPKPGRRRRLGRGRGGRMVGMISAGATASAIAVVAVSALGREEPSRAGDNRPAAASATPAVTVAGAATADDAVVARREAAAAIRRHAAAFRQARALVRRRGTASSFAPAPTSTPAPTAAPPSSTATPVPAATAPPAAPAPTTTPRPQPTATASPAPKPRPTSTPAPTTTPAPTPKPDVIPDDGDEFCFPGDPGCDR